MTTKWVDAINELNEYPVTPSKDALIMWLNRNPKYRSILSEHGDILLITEAPYIEFVNMDEVLGAYRSYRANELNGGEA